MHSRKFAAVFSLVLALSGGLLLRGGRPTRVINRWIAEPNMREARSGACSALLPDGRVLITGGANEKDAQSSAEIFGTSGAFSGVAPMLAARKGHACVALPDGRVLVAGGRTSGGGVTNSAELYDPASGSWNFAASMLEARAGATASSLPGGRVLFAGGETSGGAPTASLEVYDAVADTFVSVSRVLSSPRKDHAAAVLYDGRVLIAGGSDGVVALDSVDLYDPVAGTVAQAAKLSTPRAGLSATRLLDGKVFLAGGNNGEADLASTEIFDPAKGTVSPAASMSVARRNHRAFRIPENNQVLIVGGTSAGAPVATAESFVPWQNRFVAMEPLPESRTDSTGSALKLGGAVMLAGGVTALGTTNTAVTLTGPTVKTDKADYSPGETVIVTGTGWTPGETVILHFVESPLIDVHPDLTAVADGSGNILNNQLVMNDLDVGITFTLTATGQTSGLTAATTFTDARNLSLTFAGTGSGSVTVTPSTGTVDAPTSCGGTGSGAASQTVNQTCSPNITTSANGAVVTFSASAALGSAFTGWSAPNNLSSSTCTGTTNPCSAVFGANPALTATFAPTAAITITTSPAGRTISVDGGGSLTAPQTFTWIVGSSHTITTTSPQTIGTTQYVFNNWSDGLAISHSITVPASATTYTANFTTQYQLTFAQSGIGGDSTGTVVTINGSPKTAAVLPFSAFFDSGSTVTYGYSDPVASTVANKQYALTTPQPVPASPITVSAAATVTGTYKTQFKVSFAQSGIGGDTTATVVTVGGTPKTAASLPFTTDWLDSGSSLIYSYADPVASTVTGKRYALTTPAPTPPSPITVSTAVTVTGTYKTQFQITFAQSGIGADSTGTVVTVAGSPKMAAALPFNDWFDSGSNVAYAYSTPVASTATGKRYTLTTPAPAPASPITVSGSATVTGTYKIQYQITFTQTGIGGDTTATVVTVTGSPKTAAALPFTDWFDDASSLAYSYSDPVASTVTNKQYALTSPAPAPASPITVSGSITVTGTYKTQYKIVFTQTGIGADSTGMVVTVAGAPKVAGDLPFTTDWLDSGSSLMYSYADPVASTVLGKRYALTTPAPTPPSPVTVSAAVSVIGTYKVQFQISFAQSGINGDSTGTVVTVAGSPKMAGALPFSDWFDSGSSVAYVYSTPVASTVTGKRYTLTTPTPAPASPITVSGSVTVTGTYKIQYQITFAQSGIGGDSTGTVVTVAGSPKTAAALPFTDWFDDASSLAYGYSDPVASTVTNKQYALTMPAPTPISPITVSGPMTVTGTYKTQYKVIFTQTGIGGDSTGTVVTVAGVPKTAGDLPFTTEWLDSGSSLMYSYADPVASTAAGKRYGLTTPMPSPASPITLLAPNTVTGTYKVQYQITFAQSGINGDSTGTVVTVAGSPKTAAALPFSDWFDNGSSVTYTYSDPVSSTVSGKRYALTTPAASPASPITVSGSTTVTGIYKIQFQITFTQSGIGGDSTGTVVTVAASPKTAAVLPFNDWFDNGSSLTYAYSDPVSSTIINKRYALTTPPPTPPSPITVSASITVTGTYKEQYRIIFAQSGIGGDSTGPVVTVGGSPKTAGDLPFTTDWLDSGSSLAYSYSDPVASSISGKRYGLTSPAPMPGSPITISSPATVTGAYKVQFQVTFAQSGINGDSTGAVVTIAGSPKTKADLPFSDWFDSGSSVAYVYNDPVASTVSGKRYTLTAPAMPASPISVSGSTVVTATYKIQYQVTFAQNGIGGDSTGTVVTVAGSPKTAAVLPFSNWFDDASNLIYTYSDPVASTVANKQYALTTPTPSPGSPITVSGPITVTGTYKTQFKVIFTQSGIGGDSTGTVVTVGGAPKTAGDLPFTTDWLDDGANLGYGYADPVASTLSGKRYALTMPSPSPGSPITVSSPATVTGTYKVQFQITFAESGINGDSIGTVVTVAGIPKAKVDLPFSDWFDSGSSVAYTYADPVASTLSGKRYTLTIPAAMPASPITVSAPSTVTGTYKIQFQITFAQSGIGGDSTGTVITVAGSPKMAAALPFSDWFDIGSNLGYAYSDPVASTLSGKRYALTTPAPTPASPITVSGSITVTGTYKEQFQIVFTQSGIGGDSTGTVVTVAGVPKTAASLPFTTGFLDSGTSLAYSYSSPVASTIVGKLYALTTPAPAPASPVTVSGSTTVAGNYIVQVMTTTSVVSSSNPSLLGAPLTFTATVAPLVAGLPTGTVTFKDGATTIGSGPLNLSAQATLTTSALSLGTHSITAIYNGDSTFLSSTSSGLSQVISPSGTINVKFSRHELEDESDHPKVHTSNVGGAEVRVYTRRDPCTDGLMVTNKPKMWGKVYDGLDGPPPDGIADTGCPIVTFGSYVAKGITDANGEVSIVVPPTTTQPNTDYVVIGRTCIDPLTPYCTEFDVPRTMPDPDALYSGKQVNNIKAGEKRTVALKQLRLFNGKKVPAKYFEDYGSYLAIIEPEYMDWTSTVEQYPFVLEAVEDWGVTTTVAPPEGFVADQPALSTEVVDTVSAIQFTLTDVGSDWTQTEVTHTIRHKGKTIVHKSKVPMFDKKPKKDKDKDK